MKIYAETLQRPCQLYRHFDCDGTLLYVGIARNARRRTYQHRCTADWRDQIERTTIEDYPTRELAIEAEARAIAFEHPIYNKKRPLRAPASPCPALKAIYGEDKEVKHTPKPREKSKTWADNLPSGKEIVDDLMNFWARRGEYKDVPLFYTDEDLE